MLWGFIDCNNIINCKNPMENNCATDKVNAFFHNVEPRFESFKKQIIKMAAQNGIPFDEDVFMDTIIRCTTTFSNYNATNKDVDAYFWTAFKQNCFSNSSRDKFKNSVNLDNTNIDVLNDEYNSDIDEIFTLITNEVKNKFGENVCNAWILHICNNYTYAQLEENGYKGLNLHNLFRQIKRYIKQKFIIKNTGLTNLLRENNFI